MRIRIGNGDGVEVTVDDDVLRKDRCLDFKETAVVKKNPHLSQQGGSCLKRFEFGR